MHACLFKKTAAELPALVEHTRLMSLICAMAARLVKEGKKTSLRPRLMPSELLAMEEEERAAAESAPGKVLKLANELRAKLREWISKAERGILMANLDNDTKRNVAGFAGRYGIHAMKAMRYHGANATLTREGFIATLKNYKGSPEDAALEDDISACTLEEFLLDAKGVLPQLHASVGSIIDILSKVPLIGRTLTIQPPCDGAEMNPWLVEVVGMPTMIKVMTTYDLLHTAPEVLNMRANRTAAAVPVAPRTELMRQSSQRGVAPETSMSFEEFDAALAPLMDSPERTPTSEEIRQMQDFQLVAEHDERLWDQGTTWGGVEEFTGYLTEYEDGEDDDDNRGARGPVHRKTARRDPPPETINHLLLLPGSVGGGDRPGWMHQAATYLLLRNETLFFFDAWMGTMAATVTYLLGQPDVSAGWVQAELARVLTAFSAVYRNDNCEQFWTYCGAIGDNGTFRTALLTQSAGDSRTWMRCPHLTKPVFAMWKLIQTKEAAFTKGQLRDRQLGFLVEFFHRAKVGLQWDCPAGVSARDWLEAHSVGQVKDPMSYLSYGATLPEARKAYLREIQVALRDLAKPEEIVPGEPQIDMRGVNSARHYQFTVASIGQIFANLARLAGIQDFDPKLAPRRLATLLQVASIQENDRRAAVSFFPAAMPEEQFRKAGTRKAMGLFKSAAVVWADATFCYEYKEALRLAHTMIPKTVPAGHAKRFKQKWGVDVAAKLGLRTCGLSSVACMSPACPYFMVPMDTPASLQLNRAGEARIGCRLWLHHQPLQLIPGLHKSVQRIIKEVALDDVEARDAAAIGILNGVDLVRSPPSADRMYEEYAQALARLRKKPDVAPGRRAQLERVVMDNFDKRASLARDEYGGRLVERMEEALFARGFGHLGQGGRKQYVVKRIFDIVIQRNAWDYGNFESAVLASPLVRSQATGRFTVVARP
jgi:hypothetical protein